MMDAGWPLMTSWAGAQRLAQLLRTMDTRRPWMDNPEQLKAHSERCADNVARAKAQDTAAVVRDTLTADLFGGV